MRLTWFLFGSSIAWIQAVRYPVKKIFSNSESPMASVPLAELLERVRTDTRHGLTKGEAQRRLDLLGRNVFSSGSASTHPVVLYLQNLFGFLSILLMVAMILSFVTSEWVEGGILAFIILLNSAIGFSQEYKSERTLEALMKMTASTCRVMRDGTVQVREQ